MAHMKDLPKPMLGEITALTITAPDPDASLACYRKLGFSEVFRSDWPYPWIQITDGVLLIMLREAPDPYLALTYYVKDIDNVVKDVEARGITFTQRPQKGDRLKRYVFTSPDGLNISLVQVVEGFKQPPGPGMLQMPQEDYFHPEKYVNKTCGLFGELAHPVGDLQQSLAFWELLGFRAVSVFQSPYPWAIVSDGLSIVGLHQSARFSYPAITFFAADMPQKIARLKKAGLKELEEQGGGAVLTTPEQQHIFLFPLGAAAPKQKKIDQPVLETKRLYLRELNPEILEELFGTYTDEDIITFLGLNNKEELNEQRGNWQLGMTTYRTTFKSFLMQEKETGKIVGKAGFHNWYPLHKRAEIGYAISDDLAKRKGYTTEAVQAIVAHGFDILGLNRIEAFANPQNTPSVRILEGMGFTKEGLLRSHFFKEGRMEDSACFAILRHEYYQDKEQAGFL